jgi:pimeloyl-ACP methyl ester carboxylesterase
MPELTFRSDVELAGEIWWPERDPVIAGVVMIGGSGPTDRHNDVYFPPIRAALLTAGIAVLGYDKRGVGGSSGDWTIAGPEVLAADAVAAAAALREQPGIDPARVGLLGHSQGAWTALDVAAAEPATAFVVTSSGCGVTPGEQEVYSVERSVGASDLPADVGAAIVGFAREIVVMASARRPYADVQALTERVDDEPWYDAAVEQHVLILEPEVWSLVVQWVDHDPRAALRALRCPVLAVYGEDDVLVPAARSAAIFREEVAPGLLTVEMYAAAGHRMQIDGEFAPGYPEVVGEWIAATVMTRADGL